MKLVSFMLDGTASYGVVCADGVVDAGRRLGSRWPDLRAVIAAGASAELQALERLPPDHPLSSIQLLPPIPNPDKILCVGLNYRSHVAETGRDLPAQPSIFARLNNTLVPHGAPIMQPQVSNHLDYEGELAIVIGRPGRYVPAGEALSHVFGYSCFNDGSLRDFQKHSVTAGKNFYRTGGFGPWIVTADEIGDPTRLDLVTRLNGTEVQRSNTGMLIYSLAEIISYISQFTPLEPGDVIATGTPEGVGARRTPPLWMSKGDVVEVEISGIGVLSNPIAVE